MPYHSHPNMKLATAASTMANTLIPANCMARSIEIVDGHRTTDGMV
jgi:hypothetical protein